MQAGQENEPCPSSSVLFSVSLWSTQLLLQQPSGLPRRRRNAWRPSTGQHPGGGSTDHVAEILPLQTDLPLGEEWGVGGGRERAEEREAAGGGGREWEGKRMRMVAEATETGKQAVNARKAWKGIKEARPAWSTRGCQSRPAAWALAKSWCFVVREAPEGLSWAKGEIRWTQLLAGRSWKEQTWPAAKAAAHILAQGCLMGGLLGPPWQPLWPCEDSPRHRT